MLDCLINCILETYCYRQIDCKTRQFFKYDQISRLLSGKTQIEVGSFIMSVVNAGNPLEIEVNNYLTIKVKFLVYSQQPNTNGN